ncbi:MAG: molybdopterin cofactor-binding domain-containing protein [Cloacibacillus sp.]
MTKVFKTVKHSPVRLEAADKLSGKAVYTDDISLPNMAYAKVIRSEYANALVLAIDLKEAEKVPGYIAALLPDEVPQTLYNCSGNPPSALLLKDEKILTMQPKCAGDRILCIAADSPEACEAACRAVKIEYQEKKPIFSIEEALKEGAETIEPHLSDDNVIWKREVTEGCVEDGFLESDIILEETFNIPPMQHTAIEPTCCICDFSSGKEITIWSNSQTIFQERRIISELCGLRENKIRIIKPAVGGGFGARQQLHSQPAAVFLSKKIKRPVKILNTREEELTATVVRHGARARVRIGAGADGEIKAFYADYKLNTGPYTTHGPTVLCAGARKFQYGIKNYFFDGRCVLTNHATAGAFRGYGNMQLAFAREVIIDRLAQKLDMDPIELRLKNHVRVGGHFPGSELTLTSCEIEQCVKLCLNKKNEIEKNEATIENDDIKQAWGVAFACHGSGPSSKEGLSSAVIIMNDDGSAELQVGSSDIGQGSETMLAQIAAETLDIPLEDITVTAADTKFTPYDTGTFGSSQTFICGNAVLRAGQDLIATIQERLSRISNAPVLFEEGRFIAGEKNLSVKEAAKEVFFNQRGGTIIGRGDYKAAACPNPFSVCMVKAEYHKKLNAIRLLHLIEAVDVGTPINPLTVEGQIEGGAAQGVGYTLTEQIQINNFAKKPMSTDLLHYKIPLMADMPRIHALIAEGWEPDGPYGAKSVGELSTVPIAPAIVNAVRRASGQEVTNLPLCEQFIVLPNKI